MTQIGKNSNFMDNLIHEIITRKEYYCSYMIFPRKEFEIDRDCLVEAIENNPKLSDKHKRVLEYVYEKNMKYINIAKIEGLSAATIRYFDLKAVNIIMHRYFVIKADKEKNWKYLQDLELSTTTFNSFSRKGIVLIRDIYDHPDLIKEMSNSTKAKKEIYEQLYLKGFGLTIFNQ